MPLFQTHNGLVFFSHIPKCAGMSIENCFSHYPTHLKNPNLHGKNQLQFPCSPQHFHAEIIEKMFSIEAFAYSFTVVRNPFDRILSEYKFRSDIAQRQSREMLPIDSWLEHSLTEYRKDKYFLDNHLRPQVDFILPQMEIFKLEDGLDSILTGIQQKLPGISLPHPTHANTSNTQTPVPSQLFQKTPIR